MKRRLPIFYTTLFILTLSSFASPEKDSVRISSNLRAFSDEQWATIAGAKSTERYEIVKGDTLWDVSARLFGDSKVWPKVWEINNVSILNPHMIEPHMTLVFSGGTGTSLPTVAFAETKEALDQKSSGVSTVTSHYKIDKNDHPGPLWDERTPKPSSEWRHLPRQSWENVQTELPPTVDKNGFDTKNRIYLRKPATGIELPAFVACEPLNSVGTIVGTRSIANYSFVGSEVTIEPKGEPLQADTVYTMVDPSGLDLNVEGRQALSFEVNGKIRIIGVQNGTYIGEVISAKNPVERGTILIPEMKRIEHMNPIPGSEKVIGKIVADRRTGAFMTGQNKWVYINRGSKDGVQPGMLFRIFQNQDPKTLKPLTNGDVFVEGDVQILQNCGDFSLGLFVWSRGDVPELYDGMLITDISDEKIRYYFNGEGVAGAEKPAPAPPPPPIDVPKKEAVITPSALPPKTLTVPESNPTPKATPDDWLDKLDNGQNLRSEEEKELEQLKTFDEAKAKAAADARKAAEAKAAGGTSPGALLPPPPQAEATPPPAPQAVAPQAQALPPPPPEATGVPVMPANQFPAQEPATIEPKKVTAPTNAKSAYAPKTNPTAVPNGMTNPNSMAAPGAAAPTTPGAPALAPVDQAAPL